jgi:hypothetical protein
MRLVERPLYLGHQMQVAGDWVIEVASWRLEDGTDVYITTNQGIYDNDGKVMGAIEPPKVQGWTRVKYWIIPYSNTVPQFGERVDDFDDDPQFLGAIFHHVEELSTHYDEQLGYPVFTE